MPQIAQMRAAMAAAATMMPQFYHYPTPIPPPQFLNQPSPHNEADDPQRRVLAAIAAHAQQQKAAEKEQIVLRSKSCTPEK
jgi:hypothetical protein